MSKLFKLSLSVLTAVTLSACAPLSAHSADDVSHSTEHNEPTPYNAEADGWDDVNAALNRAIDRKVDTIVVMGANWCHDSRGLAAQFEKPRFQSLISEHYELVYIDVGEKDRNIDIAQSFGVDSIVGTPTVFIVDTNRQVRNLDTAPTWRNAASRTEDAIYDYFAGFVTTDTSTP